MVFFAVLLWIHITKIKRNQLNVIHFFLYMIFPLHSFSGSVRFGLNITFYHFTVFHHFNLRFVFSIEFLHSSDNFIQFNWNIQSNWIDSIEMCKFQWKTSVIQNAFQWLANFNGSAFDALIWQWIISSSVSIEAIELMRHLAFRTLWHLLQNISKAEIYRSETYSMCTTFKWECVMVSNLKDILCIEMTTPSPLFQY